MKTVLAIAVMVSWALYTMLDMAGAAAGAW